MICSPSGDLIIYTTHCVLDIQKGIPEPHGLVPRFSVLPKVQRQETWSGLCFSKWNTSMTMLRKKAWTTTTWRPWKSGEGIKAAFLLLRPDLLYHNSLYQKPKSGLYTLMALLSALSSFFQKGLVQTECGGLCLLKHTYLHAMLRKSTATMATWSLWVCGRYKKLFQACGTWCLILYSRRRVTKKAPDSADCLLSSKNDDDMAMFVFESMRQLLGLATKPYRRFPMPWACLPKTTLAFYMCSFPLALVLWIMIRRIHNQMRDTCFSHVQLIHVLSTKNATMYDKWLLSPLNHI